MFNNLLGSTSAMPSNELMASVNASVNSPAAPSVTPTTGAPTVPGVGGVDPAGAQGGGFFGPNFAANGKMLIGGIQTLGSLWNSFQQQKLAKKSFALQEEAFRTNIANSSKTYNTALEDRIRARYHTEGRSSGEADAYVNQHKL